ncbi:hypothetical protein IFM61392_10217 [Aspergillus lentulus]|nr:hypothetical protein IFM61392_10217 [Aspergillus lentulus]
MGAPRTSNIRRTIERNNCRKLLAQHIGEKLGLTISPDQVRTKPRQDDPYRWFLSERVKEEGLFDSNLSDLSSGKFGRILKALENEEIEAVPPEFEESPINEGMQNSASDYSFPATIRRLEQEKNDALSNYEELRASCSRLTDEISMLKQELEHLQDKNQKNVAAIHAFKQHLAEFLSRIQEHV